MSESKIKKPTLSFPVTFEKIDEIKSGNTRFTRLKCFLMHTNENLNYSSFSREVIEEALPTLAYIPVVGFIENNEFGEEDFSDHRYIITKDNGEVKRVYKGSAYGVVLSSEDNNAHFETKICEDGIEREFLVADAIAWNFLEDSSQILNRDIIKDHSIELDENSVEGYEDENGIFHFSKFSFRAACVLGGSTQAAMTGSVVEVVNFSMNDFARDIQKELINKYSEFTKMMNDTKSFTSQVNEKNNQGGIVTMSNTDFAAQFDNISAMVRQHEMFTNKFNEEHSRFEVVDIREKEAIVVDKANGYNCFGLSFTEDDGGKIEIDFESAKKKKICFGDCTEDDVIIEGAFDFGKHISEIENSAFAKVEEANAKVEEAENKTSEFEAKVSEFETAKNEIEESYNQIKAEFEEMKPKYEDYVQAEQARIDAELEAQKEAEFAKYGEFFKDNAEFAELKDKKAEMSADEIKSKLAIMFTEKTLAQTTFSKVDDGIMTAGLVETSGNEGFYESARYGNVPVKR